MNEKELLPRIHASMYQQCMKRGYATPVDVLMDVDVLSKKSYEDWRFGKVAYLEKVCVVNLHKLSFIMQQIRSCAKMNGYQESFTCYKQWGNKSSSESKKVLPLRFSKSGDPTIERAYATHYLDVKRIEEIKEEKHNTGMKE